MIQKDETQGLARALWPATAAEADAETERRECRDRARVVGTIACDQCGERHPASYDHEGRFGEGPIYAIVCADGLVDYYTAERVRFGADK